MPYIVDGHNLLGQTPGLSLTSPEDRRALLARLTAFCRGKRTRMTVFFDGDPPEGWRSDMHLGGVRVLHSGGGRSADDAILEMIRKSRAPADVTLVTSDRALYERGRHLGAKGMLGHRFREMMSREPHSRSFGGDKPERPSPEEVAYFLELFGGAGETDPSKSRKRR
jgi:predicted RNA-binding protein with PIN domain